MSKEIVENLMEQIKGLAVAERNKFSSYKTRNLRQNLSEAEAVINAAARIGIFPRLSQEVAPVLEAVGETSEAGGKILSFPILGTAQGGEKSSSNTPPTTSNTAPTVSDTESISEAIENATDSAAPTTSNTAPTVFAPMPKSFAGGWDWLKISQLAIYGSVFSVGTLALTYLSAEAAGGGPWAWFWAIVSEGVGAAFLIHPAKNWKRKLGLVVIGGLCILLGFSTMLSGVFKKSDSELTQTVASNADVKDIEDQIVRAKTNIEAAEKQRDELPASWVSKKREAQRDIDGKSTKLDALYDQLRAARGSAAKNTSASLIGAWTGVESARRLILLLVNIVVGHAFVGCWGDVMSNRRRR